MKTEAKLFSSTKTPCTVYLFKSTFLSDFAFQFLWYFKMNNTKNTFLFFNFATTTPFHLEENENF